MDIKPSFFDKALQLDTIRLQLENGLQKEIDILRLDKLHPTISGNKWFKLKYNLLEAQKQQASSVLSFGGAFSNHLHALAYAGKLLNFKTIGIVRGEEVNNPTLNDCKTWGMELHFVSRSDYKRKAEADYLSQLEKKFPGTYCIPEGGDNALGQKGCEEILQQLDMRAYDVLACSIGTGTTLSGLSTFLDKEKKNKVKQVWGFAPFKNAYSLQEKIGGKIRNLLYIDKYHFGGFGKSPEELLAYSQSFEIKNNITLDKIYTAKMFFGLEDYLNKNVVAQEKRILAIHTGGLQGNRSSN